MPVDLDALAVQVGREAVAQVVRDEPGQQPSPETIACVLAGRLDDRQAPRFAILGARAMLAKLRELGLIFDSTTQFTIPHDGFVGDPIGAYVTREGKKGVVLQQIGTQVVHVYGRKWIDGQS